MLVWTGGLAALSASLTDRTAWAIGRLGVVSVVLGAAVHIAEFSIEGDALPTLADTWATAAPADRASLEYGARLVLVAIVGGVERAGHPMGLSCSVWLPEANATTAPCAGPG